jgi:putative transposase
VDRPNQVWAADITYLPMRRGFLYLVAIIDWFTRKVLAWRISNTLEADFCVEALNEAVHKFGVPEIMNYRPGQPVHVLRVDGPAATDGGSHLDGRQGPVPRQHLRRATMAHAQIRVRLPARLGDRVTGPAGIRKWMEFYNRTRPHSALGGKPPAVIYWQAIDQNQPDQQVQRVA